MKPREQFFEGWLIARSGVDCKPDATPAHRAGYTRGRIDLAAVIVAADAWAAKHPEPESAERVEDVYKITDALLDEIKNKPEIAAPAPVDTRPPWVEPTPKPAPAPPAPPAKPAPAPAPQSRGSAITQATLERVTAALKDHLAAAVAWMVSSRNMWLTQAQVDAGDNPFSHLTESRGLSIVKNAETTARFIKAISPQPKAELQLSPE